MEIYRNNFSFHATHFEEWMNGRCYNKGVFETDIVAEATKRDIRFYISDVGSFNMNDSAVFEFGDEITELILDRIVYNHFISQPDPLVPIECQLFRDGAGISCIRFTMTSPLRIIEFYGYTVEIGQKHRHPYQESNKIETADSIISNLKATRRFNAEELMSVAYRQYELYSDASSGKRLWGIVESLKLFVETYKLLTKQSLEEGKTSMLLPKVCLFISLCNFKIYNIEQAYYVAKWGLVKVEEAINDCVFSNLPPHLLGAEDLKQLVNSIEQQFPSVINNYDENIVDPCCIDTGRLSSTELNDSSHIDKLTADELEHALDKLLSIQKSLQGLFAKTSNSKIKKAIEQLEEYKYPLYYAWKVLDDDSCPELDEETLNNPAFLSFISNLKSDTNRLLEDLRNNSFFRMILKNDNVTEELIQIYTLIMDEITDIVLDIDDFCNYEDMDDDKGDGIIASQAEDRTESHIPAILRQVLVFKSNEHQRYEHGKPVMGLQKCLRTIQIEVNKNGCKGYKLEPGDGFIVKIFNNDTMSSQMSAKPMRLYKNTDDLIELRGYPLLAMSPFGWQPVDYSCYGFTLHLENGVWTKCCMHMFDRDVVIEYRYSDKHYQEMIEYEKTKLFKK